MKLLKYSILFFLTFALASCGRQGPPRPPEDFAPGRVSNFRVAADVDGLTLFWEAPKTTATGRELVDLANFVVRRAIDNKEDRLKYEDIAEVGLSAEPNAVYQYRDSGLTPGERYVYYVFAQNEEGVSGASSYALRVYFRGSSSIIER